MSRIAALLLASLLAAPSAWGKTGGKTGKTEKVKEATLPNGLVVHEHRLANGMRLLLVPDHSAPVFTYQVWFQVGAAAERLDPRLKRTGLAHFFEHMMFRGTKKVPGSGFDRAISEAGAVGTNATTSVDRTNYFQSLPKEQLELIFRLESDRMANLIIDQKTFDTERGAVLGELKLRNDRPNVVAYDALWAMAYDKSPYRFGVIGTEEELRSFTVADAEYFYKTYYAPNEATLILVGDFSTPRAIALAEKYYGPMQPKKAPQTSFPAEPEQEARREKEISHPLTNTNLLGFAYRIPGSGHPDMAALEAIGSVLAVGDGSILEQRLVQGGLVSRVTAGPYRCQHSCLFAINVTMAPGKADEKAVEAVEEALARLRDGKITEAELERAKNQYLLMTYTDLLRSSSVGSNLGESLVTTGNYLNEFELLERLKKLTVSDLQRVAKTYLTGPRTNFLRLVPAKPAKPTEAGKGAQ